MDQRHVEVVTPHPEAENAPQSTLDTTNAARLLDSIKTHLGAVVTCLCMVAASSNSGFLHPPGNTGEISGETAIFSVLNKLSFSTAVIGILLVIYTFAVIVCVHVDNVNKSAYLIRPLFLACASLAVCALVLHVAAFVVAGFAASPAPKSWEAVMSVVLGAVVVVAVAVVCFLWMKRLQLRRRVTNLTSDADV